MPERLTPGVYVEEISSGIKPIAGVATSTAGFIGEAARGIPDTPTLVTGYASYASAFGGHQRGDRGYLSHAVKAFFDAGGRRAYIVRVLPGSAVAGSSAALAARGADSLGVSREVLRFDARGKGEWSKHLRVHIEDATAFPDAAFKVRVEWVEAGQARTVETFDNVRMDPDHEDYVVDVIENGSRYVRAVDLYQAALDAEPQTVPGIPEQVARLETVGQGAARFTVYEGAKLDFYWADAGSTARSGASATTVGFDQAAVTAAGAGSFANGRIALTATQLSALLTTALGSSFRVTRNGGAGDNSTTVSIEPAVASRAVQRISPPGSGTTYNLQDRTVSLQVLSGAIDQTVTADFAGAGSDAVTASALAAALQAAVDGAAALDGLAIEVEAVGNHVVATSAAATDGVAFTLSLAPTGGGAAVTDAWSALALAGAAGTVVDDQGGVTLTVSERLQVGVPRMLADLGLAAKAVGLGPSSAANPVLRPALTGDDPHKLAGGIDSTTKGDRPGATQFAGDAADRSGLHAFDTVRINLLCMPGKTDPAYLSAAMAWCDAADTFFVADGPGSLDRDFSASAEDVRRTVEGLPARSKNAAMFYPWLRITDPVGVGRNPTRFVPPSGHVAGVFARTDNSRGVWKAPAGLEAVLPGVVGMQHDLVDGDQDLLNPIGLNCIRQFPGSGIVSWGSRTLSSDPEWRYVPVRRTALFLKESLKRGMQWAVFEPNDEQLWDRIRINITAFMLSMFRQGAFQGVTPDEAFLVKCDRETNPQELVDQGVVTAQVAFAPLKPAEFVVVQISQKTLLTA